MPTRNRFLALHSLQVLIAYRQLQIVSQMVSGTECNSIHLINIWLFESQILVPPYMYNLMAEHKQNCPMIDFGPIIYVAMNNLFGDQIRSEAIY